MRRTIHAAAAALLAWTAGGTLAAEAADLSLPPVYQPDSSPLVELGSGWYLRADMAAYDLTYKTNDFGTLSNTNFGATLGFGYQFNSMFRVDLTYDYMTPFTKNTTLTHPGYGASLSVPLANTPSLGCPVSADPLIAGNVYTVGCTANFATKLTTNTYLVNAYLDLAHWYGLTPYIGAGAGLAYVQTQKSVLYRFSDGTLYGDGNKYCGGATGLNGINCYHLGYWNNNGPKVTNYNFAYALMAGFSYDISSLLKVDIGYRYVNLGSNISSQEFRAGVRITPDG
jgi:opacity protein-like surface antigen